MAGSDNVTKQKSDDFEDTIYDPDIEARLYAEIYYSNETYAEDLDHQTRTNETSSIVDNVRTPSSSTKTTLTNAIDINPGRNKENNLPIINNFVQDQRETVSESGQYNFSKPFDPSQNWIFGELPQYFSNQVHRPDGKKIYPKRQRLLAHEGLWATPEVAQERCEPTGSAENSTEGHLERPEVTRDFDRRAGSAENSTKSHLERPEVTRDFNRRAENTEKRTENYLEIPEATRDRNRWNRNPESSTTEGFPVTPKTLRIIQQRIDDNTARRKAGKQKRALKNKERKERQRNKNSSILISTKAFTGTRNLRCRRDTFDNAGVTPEETSKYHVVAKKKKLKMRETSQESVEISSDSDDSILEVPIPPKAPPPVIQLPDSDDESGKTSKNEKSSRTEEEKNCESSRGTNEETTPCYSIETDSSDESLARPTRESSPSLNEVDEETREVESMNEETTRNNIEFSAEEVDNLMLNCTDIQRGASSLEEIKKNREGVFSHGHSDDSMTESEVTNWVNIAAEQADKKRDRTNLTIDDTIDKVHPSLWDSLTFENNTAIETNNGTFLNTSVETIIDDTLNKRKRCKTGESSTSREFSVPEIPEKRTKRKTNKTINKESSSEYFFKPMSKEMQAFYNNPWGGENLDVFDIQSRMPRNPNCWTILDSDLRGPSPRRNRACPRCKTDSHYGKRCPEKPKPPCCSMCGITGHTETRCPETMCLTCGNKYATYRPTCSHCSKLFCNMCHGTGHTSENCPDLWRRYHNTTTELLPVVPKDPRDIMKAPQYLSCCNCAKRGHDVTMCRQLRWSQHFTTPMYVSNYTDGPIYLSSFQERIQATNSPSFVDLTEVSNTEDAPDPEFPNFSSQNRLIVNIGLFNKSNSENVPKISKRLDQLTNVHLNGLLSGNSKPRFLYKWQKNFDFKVQITHGPDDLVLLVIQGRSNTEICSLEKILMQWLTRRDNEKQCLAYHKLPYNNFGRLMKELRSKLVLLSRLGQPWILLKKITTMKEIGTEAVGKNQPFGMIRKSKQWRENIEKQGHLVASLYKKSWVEGGEEIIQSFRDKIHDMEGKTEMTVEHYLEIVYLYNEIFTYRESEALTRAMKNAVPPSLFHEPINQPLQNNDRDKQNLENPQIPNVNNFYVDSSPTTTNFLPVVDQPGSSGMTTNFPDTQNSNFIPPLMSTDPLSLDESRLLNSQPTLLLNHYGKKNKMKQAGGEKVQAGDNGLLINLSKKKRKAFRRSAREAIKMTKSSSLSHLKKMGDDLRMKLMNNSIRTDDVQLLKMMLQGNSTQKNIMRRKAKKLPNQPNFFNLCKHLH